MFFNLFICQHNEKSFPSASIKMQEEEIIVICIMIASKMTTLIIIIRTCSYRNQYCLPKHSIASYQWLVRACEPMPRLVLIAELFIFKQSFTPFLLAYIPSCDWHVTCLLQLIPSHAFECNVIIGWMIRQQITAIKFQRAI